jgi:hypothetical protein
MLPLPLLGGEINAHPPEVTTQPFCALTRSAAFDAVSWTVSTVAVGVSLLPDATV